MTIRIVIADMFQISRHCIASLLALQSDFAVVGETGDGTELPGLVADSKPHVVLMGPQLVHMSGAHATRLTQSLRPLAKIIGLSDTVELELVRDMVKAGASAFLGKAADADELALAIRIVMDEKRYYFCNRVIESLLDRLVAPQFMDGRFTAREQALLRMIARASTTAEMADEMSVSHSAVRKYVRILMNKLELQSKADLTRYAVSVST